MNIPENLKYTEEHEWVKIEDGTAVMGITDFAQKMLTDVVFVELPEVGKQVEKGKPFIVVESVKSVSDVFAVLSGEVMEVNETVADDPALVNQDPYGKGWLVKIKISSVGETDSLLTHDAYLKLCEGEENK